MADESNLHVLAVVTSDDRNAQLSGVAESLAVEDVRAIEAEREATAASAES